MNLIAACGLVVFALQDPDRSTPEKAFESFNAFWDGMQKNGERFFKLMEAAEQIGDFLRTEELKAVRAKSREESAKAREDYKTLSTSHAITGRSEGPDGSVTIEGDKKTRTRKRNYQTKELEETDETAPERVIFVKVGATWLVREIQRACFACKATGACASCKGSGKFGDQECFSCKGKKTCATCSGEKMRKEKLGEARFGFAIPDGEPKYATDLSTPKATAQAYVDALKRGRAEQTVHLRKFVDEILVKFRLHFAPDVLKSIDDSIARELEAGRKRFAEGMARVESVDEKGEEAWAVVVTPPDDPSGKPQRVRAVMKKSGDKWLVSAEQRGCWSCDSKGACRGCKGAGVSEGGSKCFTCGGSKSCSACKGTGWTGE